MVRNFELWTLVFKIREGLIGFISSHLVIYGMLALKSVTLQGGGEVGLAMFTYLVTYRTLALFCAPEIPHLFTYSTLTLNRATISFNHISDTINTIIELNINNRSKISYLSSLIFEKIGMYINGVFSHWVSWIPRLKSRFKFSVSYIENGSTRDPF